MGRVQESWARCRGHGTGEGSMGLGFLSISLSVALSLCISGSFSARVGLLKQGTCPVLNLRTTPLQNFAAFSKRARTEGA